MAEGPPEDCVHNYHVMQAHHDHCLHDSLPKGIEKALHDYEHFYDDCFVKRQFNPELSTCPEVDCSDATAMTKAIATLQAGCTTTQACADATCSAAIKTVLAVHDLCSESDLPNIWRLPCTTMRSLAKINCATQHQPRLTHML